MLLQPVQMKIDKRNKRNRYNIFFMIFIFYELIMAINTINKGMLLKSKVKSRKLKGKKEE